MRRLVMIDMWLLLIGWCLFLNGYALAGEAAMLLACGLPLIRRKKIVLFMVPMALCMYYVMLKTYHGSVLHLYFKDLPYLLFFICGNTVMIYPAMRSLKRRNLLRFLFIAILSASLFSLMVLLVPENDYSLLGRQNLFLLLSFIFLPHIITMLMAAIAKQPIRHLQIKKEALLP